MGQASNSGHHALQNYTFGLMLLEMQNKKRLMLARMEQEDTQRRERRRGQGKL
jgi:hypothetical protein